MPHALWRIAWTIVTIVVVQAIVCGLAMLPVVLIWSTASAYMDWFGPLRPVAISLAIVPSYVLFALTLMLVSAATVRTLRWNTPRGVETRLADFDWPLLRWARSMAATHIVRLFAGLLFRGSPVWTFYLRLAGARLGRRVYVNSLAVTDYNLLDFGSDVVVGDDAHLSGHIIEDGVLKTAALRIGSRVTIGLGSFIEIGVDVGDGCQVAAFSLVPKHTRLEPGGVYAGITVHCMSSPRPVPQQTPRPPGARPALPPPPDDLRTAADRAAHTVLPGQEGLHDSHARRQRPHRARR